MSKKIYKLLVIDEDTDKIQMELFAYSIHSLLEEIGKKIIREKIKVANNEKNDDNF